MVERQYALFDPDADVVKTVIRKVVTVMAGTATGFAEEQSSAIGHGIGGSAELGVVSICFQAQRFQRGFIFLRLGFLKSSIVVLASRVGGRFAFCLCTFLDGGHDAIVQGVAAQDRTLVSGQR